MPYYFISRIILIATKRYYFQDKRVDILSWFHYVLCKLAIYVIWYILALCWSSTANIVWRIRLRMKYWKVWISRLIEWFRYYFFFSKAVLLISGNLNHPAKPFAIAKIGRRREWEREISFISWQYNPSAIYIAGFRKTEANRVLTKEN